MSSIIEQLKTNTEVFGLMSEEMQDKTREIGSNNFRAYFDGKWGEKLIDKHGFCSYVAYRLCAEYEEKPPAIVEYKIELRDGHLHFKHRGVDYCLSCAYNIDGFIGFKFDDNQTGTIPIAYDDNHKIHHATHVLFSQAK